MQQLVIGKVIEISTFQKTGRQLTAQEVRLEADNNLSPHALTNPDVPNMFRCTG